jgi:Lon-like ATP-dependent protease
VTAKIEAAIDAGIMEIIIPASNKEDVLLDARHKDKAIIHTASNIAEVFDYAFAGEKKADLVERVMKMMEQGTTV